jgi:pimeloyl-ACP methyl ester carboxylesterase
VGWGEEPEGAEAPEREIQMPSVRANGITIEYEEFGRRDSTPLLLIMGLGAQMVMWHEGLCGQFVARGFRVIRYDNRDVGLSTKFHDVCPNPAQLIADVFQGKSVKPPYSLEDMAQDAAGLLQALGIPSAHVVGASMGGMIAQVLAIQYPQHVLTLTSIMSTTGNPNLPQPEPDVLRLLMQTPPAERQGAIEHGLRMWRALHGPGFEFDEVRIRELVELAYDRDPDPEGTARQLLAIVTAPSRKEQLGSLAIPALVIHGDADPLVPIAAGYDTAEAIPGARTLVIGGMGHELPEGAWPRVVDAVCELAQPAH